LAIARVGQLSPERNCFLFPQDVEGFAVHSKECFRKANVAYSAALELLKLQFEPYAPVRRQLLNIVRAINRAMLEAGYEPVPIEYQRAKHHVLKPFEAEIAVSHQRNSLK
jgi:hypothetical protein